VGGGLIYQLDQRTDAFEDSLGIFVFPTDPGWGWSQNPALLLNAFNSLRPVVLLRCECGELKAQAWRMREPNDPRQETHQFLKLSSWMELRAVVSRHLPDVGYVSAVLSRPVSQTPVGSYTTPWVIPREVLCRTTL